MEEWKSGRQEEQEGDVCLRTWTCLSWGVLLSHGKVNLEQGTTKHWSTHLGKKR